MLNQTVIVGRIMNEPKLTKEDEKDIVNITVTVPRSYKNENGEFENDNIPVILYMGIARNVTEYCHKGDLIGVKGRIQMINDKINIIGEKVTFLSSSKSNEE